MEIQHDRREVFGFAYEDVERMCARKANVYRDQLEGFATDIDKDCALVISAKISAIEELRYVAAEKAKLFNSLSPPESRCVSE